MLIVEITHLAEENPFNLSRSGFSFFQSNNLDSGYKVYQFLPSLLILYKSYQVSEAHLDFSSFPHDRGWCQLRLAQIICLPGPELISPVPLMTQNHWISLGGQMWNAFLCSLSTL